MTTPQLTNEQEAALVRFARDNGRRWKAELNYIWMTGRYEGNPDACYLQQVRNQFGPGWLVKYHLSQADRTAEQQAEARRWGRNAQFGGIEFGRSQNKGSNDKARNVSSMRPLGVKRLLTRALRVSAATDSRS